MAAIDLAKADPIRDQFMGEREACCFLCGAALQHIVVYWHGLNDRRLWLHPACAKELGCHLIGDSIKAKMMHDGQFRRLHVVATPIDAAG